jgi:hypothetical protein
MIRAFHLYTGTGHKWRLINDQPWRRAYILFAPGADPQFIPANDH